MKTSKVAWVIGALASALACSAGDSPVAPGTQSLSGVERSAQSNYSFSISLADRSVRVRFLRARSIGTETVSAFITRMFASADSAGATRLILDLRSLEGGDSFVLVPLLKGILARKHFAERGGLVVLVGSRGFSPSQNLVRVLEQYAHPIIQME
ncbi:MAG: hypothetical protein ACJ791_12930 [Gemmatimonadaceae bacterium]